MTMDSTHEPEPAIKPQVIELDAEDVTADTETPSETPPLAPPRKSRISSRWVLAALILGLLLGGWLYRDLLSSYLPTNAMQSLKSRLETVEATAKTTGDQLLAVSTASDQVRAIATSLEATVKDATVAQEDLSARLAAAEKSLQTTEAALTTLRAAITSGTSGGAIDSGALAAIGQRLDALEKDVASLKADSGTGEDASVVSALRQTLSDIRAKITAGTSYREELDRIVRMVPAVGGNDVLNAYAAQGLPNAKGLAAELQSDIPTLPNPTPETATTSSGIWENFWNALTAIVTIRNIGEADWPALAQHCVELAEAGDLEQAIAEIDAAEGEKPSAITRWRDRAGARLKLENALEEMSKAVDRVIAARGGGQ
ncbi:MAG TPA: hypothetical protein VMZ01_07920 [Aestuariivirga sp.]|nr:hypothetical protein [Aestuariivirga sp.]